MTEPNHFDVTASSANNQFFYQQPPVVAPPSIPVAKKQRAPLTATSALLIGALVGGGVGGSIGAAAYYLSTYPAPVVVNNTHSVNWLTGVAAKVLPSVVTISVDAGSSAGSGSGVILTSDGYILTNNHVVTLDGASASAALQVKTTDGHIFAAKVIGTDPTNDLAVIKISALGLNAIHFADSSLLNVGDSVAALGAPLELESSVTAGIVSALDRTIQVASSDPNQSSGGSSLKWWTGNSGSAPVSMKVIQTDAAINPGNSGGALVDDKGNLIGINVAIATAGSSSSSSGQSGSIGVGFAIPANQAKRIATELMKGHKASHGLLGAMVSDNGVTGSAGFPTGAKIVKLAPGGAAEKAGLLVGDVVTHFGDARIFSAGDLTAAVRSLPGKTKTNLDVLRDGKTVTVAVTLGTLPQTN